MPRINLHRRDLHGSRRLDDEGVRGGEAVDWRMEGVEDKVGRGELQQEGRAQQAYHSLIFMIVRMDGTQSTTS